MISTKFRAWSLSGALALGTWMVAAPAFAATWTGGRTTPSLLELFAIDKTGEPGWIYGAEDVAGDGLDSFKQQEQNIDIRTAYAAADANDFWVRTYISDTASPGGNVSVYVFIDADKNPATGGSAAATSIDAKFTDDPSAGGYEYVVGIKGNRSVVGVWNWDGSQWAAQTVNPNDITVEASTDADPIQIGEPVHGYLQAQIALAVVGLTAQCNANIYVRSSNDTSSLGAGDLEVGQIGSCVPTDANNNGVPDPLENTNQDCTSNDQCPGDGVCQDGKCIFPLPCIDTADCTITGYVCQNQVCVPPSGGNCTTNADCQNGLVCISGTCQPCTPGGNQCDSGFVCGPEHRCIPYVPPCSGGECGCTSSDQCGDRVCLNGICQNCTDDSQCASGDCGSDGHCVGGLAPNDGAKQGGEDVQGGACACSLPGTAETPVWLVLLSLPTALVARRIRRRHSR